MAGQCIRFVYPNALTSAYIYREVESWREYRGAVPVDCCGLLLNAKHKYSENWLLVE